MLKSRTMKDHEKDPSCGEKRGLRMLECRVTLSYAELQSSDARF